MFFFSSLALHLVERHLSFTITFPNITSFVLTLSPQDIIHHSRAVSRAVKSAFLVADLPMGSYEISPEHAVKSAISLLQKGRAHSVKLEGGAEMTPTISRLTSFGIPE